MTDYTEKDYFDNIDSIAQEVRRRVRDEDADMLDALHEECDGNAWVIYTHRAKLALTFSRNDDAIFEEMGADALAGVGGMSEVYSKAAYFAILADVDARLLELMDEDNAAEASE